MIMTSAVDISIQAVSPLFIDALLLAAPPAGWFERLGMRAPAAEPAPIPRMGGCVREIVAEPDPKRMRSGAEDSAR
jgi:hypothetical protein